MCKLSLISLLFLTSSLSLSLSAENSNHKNNCEDKEDAYELYLIETDPDVKKFAKEGWNKLATQERIRGAKEVGEPEVQCARVQVINNERRYIILVQYITDDKLAYGMFYCTLFVWTSKVDLLSLSCFRGGYLNLEYPPDKDPFDMFHFFADDAEFCPGLIGMSNPIKE